MPKPLLFLVEDDLHQLSLYEKFLLAEGMDVVAVSTLQDSMDRLATLDAIDLAVIDFWLDGADASTLLDLLRERFPETPTLVMSGGNDTTPIETAHALAQVSGALAFLQKPFERQALLKTVNGLLST